MGFFLLFGQCHRLYSKTFFTVLPVSQTLQQNLLYCSASVTDCTANLLYSSASVTDCTANIFTILPVSQTVQQTFFTVLPVSQTVQQTFLLFCQCHRLYSEPFFIQGHFEISRPLESKKNQLLNQNPHVAISSTFSIIPAVSPHSYCTD